MSEQCKAPELGTIIKTDRGKFEFMSGDDGDWRAEFIFAQLSGSSTTFSGIVKDYTDTETGVVYPSPRRFVSEICPECPLSDKCNRFLNFYISLSMNLRQLAETPASGLESNCGLFSSDRFQQDLEVIKNNERFQLVLRVIRLIANGVEIGEDMSERYLYVYRSLKKLELSESVEAKKFLESNSL